MRKGKRPHSGRKDTRAEAEKKYKQAKSQNSSGNGKNAPVKKYAAKKSLGQHFLTSKSALSKIIDAGDVAGDDIIIEVGPGKGILTEQLMFFGGKVIAIEKDRELAAELRQTFAKKIETNRLDLIEGDILDFNPSVMGFYKKELGYKVIANIPYYITNAIIRLFLESDAQPEKMVILIQKEVAERILARDGKESLLSISVKAYGTPTIAAKVPAGSFNPPPKVDSAILVINNISKKNFSKINEKAFFQIVRASFAHKRKKVASNLTYLYSKNKIEEVFEKLNLPTDIRAEDITTSGWLILAQELLK